VHEVLMSNGSYEPLEAVGAAALHVVAFVQRSERSIAISFATRLLRTLMVDVEND
jgi:maltooligosyltrehalose synthase